MATDPPSPSASSVRLPFFANRRGSLASITGQRADPDRNALAQALDQIHTSASKSETLTSFHDFDGGPPSAGAKEIVSGGVNGLFDRVKRGLTGTPTKDPKTISRDERINKSPVPSSSRNGESPRAKHGSTGSPRNAKKRSMPDTESVASGTSALPSSLHASLVSIGTQADDSSNGQQEISELQDGPAHQKRSRTGPSKPIDKTDLTENDVPPSGRPAPSFSLEELNRARHAMTDQTQYESASQSLARVLSNHELPGDASSRRKQPSFAAEDEQAVDDSESLHSSNGSPPIAPLHARSSATAGRPNGSAHESAHKKLAFRPPLLQVGASHLPGYEPSRTSSAVDSLEAHSTKGAQFEPDVIRSRLEPSPNLNAGMQRRRVEHAMSRENSNVSHTVPQHLKRRVISKGFWMKDENAKDCFSCGDTFSTFRRKHHCRTCGQIFDGKCTVLVPGKPFGLTGSLRLCKPCESMVFGSDDESSAFSDDEDYPTDSLSRSGLSGMSGDNPSSGNRLPRLLPEISTPSIGIPVSRRNREAKQRSNILEFDGTPVLTRPSSSHSLISLARRPRSSSHRRHYSRQQAVRGKSFIAEDRGPFHPSSLEERDKRASLMSLHNDHFVDPELAPFASDEGSDDEPQPNILSAMSEIQSPSQNDKEKNGVGPHNSSARKSRSRLGTAPSVRVNRDEEHPGIASKHPTRTSRTRNTSFGSVSGSRPSPWRSLSRSVFGATMESELDGTAEDSATDAAPATAASPVATKLVRSSAMCGRDAPSVELNRASYEHVRRLLAQLLKDSQIDRAGAWEKALLPILLQCTDDVEPNVQLGDDMDIRDYIKLKKVPGGRPGDSSYVSGVVFSKNVALKSMARALRRPRIAIVTFAIEYARHQSHFMSLEPVIAQEQEYLRNLVGRIAALRPDVLLVQRHVSGLALDLLEKAGITVVYSIKESVLAAVARITQTTMIKSVDKLAMGRSHLGQCESFEVKTYVFQQRRKSYIFMSGCAPDLGCTVVLRGADTTTLRKIKRITEFMCYVAYNLKLETSLMRDEFVSIPQFTGDKLEAPDSPAKMYRERINPNHAHGESIGPPQSLAQDDDIPSKYEQMEQEVRSRILSASPFVVFTQPYMLTQLRESERRLITYKHLRDQYAAADEEGDETHTEDHQDQFSIIKPEMVHVPASKDQPKVLREYLHAVHEAQFEKTRYTYETQRRVFDSFMSGTSDPFDPHSHQTIVLLHSTISTLNSAPCTGPELLYIGFYAGLNHAEPEFEEDCTLGQYVEDCCLSANTACKDCGKSMLGHHRQYVHGYGQVSISLQSQPSKLRGYSKTVLMWATCRICKQETTALPMSENTWRYSFAKYLELSFWSAPLHPRAGVCQHDIHKDFLRCFGFEDLVMRVQYDPVDIYDVVVPRTMITWKVESDLRIKNEQFQRFVSRLTSFTESIKKRLDSINVDTLDEKTAAEAHDLLDELHSRAEQDHAELLRKLQDKYSTSRYYELIPLNRALRFMDEKALEWDEVFSDFERDYFPSETDIRKLATLQLRNMFLESQPPASVEASESSDVEEGSTELVSMSPKVVRPRMSGGEIPSEKAHDVLGSTLEEHRASIGNNGTEESEESRSLSSQISPRQDHEEAVSRHDVRHLDLAIPAVHEDEQVPRTVSMEGAAEINPGEEHLHSQPFALSPKPLSSGLLERIEQIRGQSTTEAGEQDLPETKIPRLADLKKQDATSRPSPPPLLRARTQPNQITLRASEHDRSQSPPSSSHKNDEQSLEKRLGERLGRLTVKIGKVTPSLIPRSIPARSDDANGTSVSALAKHFEQMSREFEKERLKERRQRALRSRQARANPLASSQPVVEVYHNATDAVGDRNPDHNKQEASSAEPAASNILSGTEVLAEPTTIISDDQVVEQNETEESHTNNDAHHSSDDFFAKSAELGQSSEQSREQSDPTSGMSSSTLLSPADISGTGLLPELSIPEHKKNVWFKYLAEFWSKRSASGWSNLEYPLRATEHVFEDSDIIVREDEPSSVIALSLASVDYLAKAEEFRSHPKAQSSHTTGDTAWPSSDVAEETQQKAIEASLLSDTGTHMKYSFSHGPVKASCKIFYAEAFDALRRKCGIADRFVESLSRCLKYDSKGGKTKSLFLKTMDSRFIVKSLQEVELKAFTKFAPDYFAFMGHTLFHGVPSVIAKMLGLFQVTIKNPITGMDFSYYLLVMENLFYEQNPNRRFDLKGSMRNRKIESTGQPDEVLLDENLVETIFESPLFVREHARKLLQASVWNDTMWLCKQNVMDYSLMAGFDDERKELIVGIIDCIRTYTWDKKLESWIKDRGKNKPTITSPKDYRNRFRVSMMQYMLVAPTVWHQFQAQMAAPKTLKEREEEAGHFETEKETGSRHKIEGS